MRAQDRRKLAERNLVLAAGNNLDLVRACLNSINSAGICHIEIVRNAHAELNLRAERLLRVFGEMEKVLRHQFACRIAYGDARCAVFFRRVNRFFQKLRLASAGVLCAEFNVRAQRAAFGNGLCDQRKHIIRLFVVEVLHLHG